MSERVGVAFVGAGFISCMHAIAVRTIADANLVALASNSRRAAEYRALILDAVPYTFADLDATWRQRAFWRTNRRSSASSARC